ncbi:hypothetical protein [Lysinibacillus sp. NPDC096259]
MAAIFSPIPGIDWSNSYSSSPQYSGYQWYITGHSLGGYLAAKTYLDI